MDHYQPPVLSVFDLLIRGRNTSLGLWRSLARSSMNQPLVFISCVSPEFRQTRSRVAAILTRLGYTPRRRLEKRPMAK
jgi:hypothetical protein